MYIETVHRITGPHLLLDGMGAAIWFRNVSESDLEKICTRIAQASDDVSFGVPLCTANDMGCSIVISAQLISFMVPALCWSGQ
jgi:hypothetical protein